MHAPPDGIFLVGKVNNQSTVIRQCQKARRIGIKEGSALTLAQAFLPNAIIREFEPIADFKALYRLCTWAHRYTPLNGLDGEIIDAYKEKALSKLDFCHYGINLDITGTERVHKGEQQLLRAINEKMIRARFEARIAVAQTFGAAWAFSRYIPEKIFISDSDTFAKDLGDLPIDALRLTHSTSEAMRAVGLKNIRSLLELPRKAIAKRYGSKTLRRIDQILGDEPERISPVPMPNHWAVFREFEYAINSHDQIVEIALEMIEELVKTLSEKGRRARYFILLLQGEDLWGVAYRLQKDFSILIASANGNHVKTVLFPLVERISLPGPVYLMGLSTKDTEKIEHAQIDLNGELHREAEASELLNQLAVEVGATNVKEVRFTKSFLPETSYIFSAIGQSDPNASLESKIRSRPSKLLSSPEEISAISMLPDCPPVKIRWKGQDLEVRKGFGPERINTSWFDCDPKDLVSRDYYRVEDQLGRWLWIYRNTETMKWFLQGLWM
jgi:protein ImuB